MKPPEAHAATNPYHRNPNTVRTRPRKAFHKRKVTKGEPFGRIVRSKVSDDGEYITLIHATRGVKKRQTTPHLYRELMR